MDFSHSDKVRLLQEQVGAFMDAHIYPAEARFDEEMEQNRRSGNPWQPLAVMEELKRKARAQNLWNLFLPHSEHAAGGRDRRSDRLHADQPHRRGLDECGEALGFHR